MRKLSLLIKNYLWFTAGLPGFLPATDFFYNYYPPMLYPLLPLVFGPLSLVIAYCTWQSKVSDPKKIIKMGKKSFIITFLLLLTYLVFLQFCTVLEPQSYEKRFQIGFWKFNWSLTKDGQKLKEKYPDVPLQDWMKKMAAFSPEGPQKIWKEWSISLAGIFLIILFLLIIFFIVRGLSLFAKHLAISF